MLNKLFMIALMILLFSCIVSGCCCCSTSTMNPTTTVASNAIGSKSNPAPIGTPVEFLYSSSPNTSLKITCTKVLIGDEAKNKINWESPGENKEWLVASFDIQCIDTNSPPFVYGPDTEYMCYTPDLKYNFDFSYADTNVTMANPREFLYKGDKISETYYYKVLAGYSSYVISFNDRVWFTV